MGSDVPRDHLHSISSPGDMADMYPDSGVPEEHMKYSHLQMESDQKLIKFMGGPMQRGLKGVPGVGDATIEKLKQLEIFTLDQLMGKFMSFDRDCARMLIWCWVGWPPPIAGTGWRIMSAAEITRRLASTR